MPTKSSLLRMQAANKAATIRREYQEKRRLEKAAPALLAACKAVFPILMYRHQHGDCTCLEGKDCPYADVALAIARAEGREAVK